MIAETISNPLLKVCDIEACAEIAHENGARLIIDNTFATPYLRQPLKLGADMVVHSATKYLGGHADAMGGVVVSRDEMDGAALVSVMKLVGGVLGVWEAHEILRGLKTLAVRMERQCENARSTRQLSAASMRAYRSRSLSGAGRARFDRAARQHAGSGVSFYGRVEVVRAFDESRRRFYKRAASGNGFAPRSAAGAKKRVGNCRWVGAHLGRDREDRRHHCGHRTGVSRQMITDQRNS